MQGQDVRNELVLKSDCVCIGFSITYECTVTGRPGGATVWTGTAFDCPGNEITLLHHRFPPDNGPAIGECNDGAIRGRSVQVNGSLYTSQLTVTVTADVIGESIECIHDHAGGTDVIGSTNIILTTSKLKRANIK